MINPSNPPDAISPQYFAVAIDKSPKKIFRVNIPDEDKKKENKKEKKKGKLLQCAINERAPTRWKI